MSDWTIHRYDASMASEWNSFVAQSRNATFLFDRGYMDYHADRFTDCSWVVRKKGRIMALLPADITDDGVLRSHGGLTYGGWILPVSHMDGADMLDIFSRCVEIWKHEGFTALDYKPLPYIYASRPSQEDEYALFRLGAVLAERNLSSTIDMRHGWQPDKMQRRHLKAASSLPITIEETDDTEGFVSMLQECLRMRHDAAPVHTAAELEMLRRRFSENIRIFVTRFEGGIHAGVCVYDTGLVAHAQYIATSSEGRRLNLLTPLFHTLITDRFADRRYFDFGISNEDHGRYLNSGLLRQKTSYGAGATVYSRFTLSLSTM